MPATATASPFARLPLHDPARASREPDGEPPVLAVIEATQGSANKLKFEPELGVFRLHASLPLGAVFPYDFGFLPSTLGEDGDPLDVLVLMDEPVAPGTVVACRLLGVIEAEQQPREPGSERKRNDRLLCVADTSHRYGHCRALDDLATPVIEQIEHFFISYNDQRGEDFRPLGRGGPDAARRLVAQGAQAHEAHQARQAQAGKNDR
jgi:inorganic pyrophosphatase